MFPLSKTLNPADFDELKPELVVVDRYFTSAREQHPMRRWEYALALRAWEAWGGTPYHAVVDVGGGGSPFLRMLPGTHARVVVDPDEGETGDLAHYLTDTYPHPPLADVVFCLSVLEHVEDLDQFCYHLSCLVAPGGLLFLTFDYAERQPDTYHFHWMRQRIFTLIGVSTILSLFGRWELDLLGGPAQYPWIGPQVMDYTFASLALIKRA